MAALNDKLNTFWNVLYYKWTWRKRLFCPLGDSLLYLPENHGSFVIMGSIHPHNTWAPLLEMRLNDRILERKISGDPQWHHHGDLLSSPREKLTEREGQATPFPGRCGGPALKWSSRPQPVMGINNSWLPYWMQCPEIWTDASQRRCCENAGPGLL